MLLLENEQRVCGYPCDDHHRYRLAQNKTSEKQNYESEIKNKAKKFTVLRGVAMGNRSYCRRVSAVNEGILVTFVNLGLCNCNTQ